MYSKSDEGKTGINGPCQDRGRMSGMIDNLFAIKSRNYIKITKRTHTQ